MPLARSVRPGMRVVIGERGMVVGEVGPCNCAPNCGYVIIVPKREARGREQYESWRELREMPRHWDLVIAGDLVVGDELPGLSTISEITAVGGGCRRYVFDGGAVCVWGDGLTIHRLHR